MQSRLSSFQEALIGTVIGFLISLLVQQYIINPMFSLNISFTMNIGIVAIFTVFSVLRSYVMRRVFNHHLTRK